MAKFYRLMQPGTTHDRPLFSQKPSSKVVTILCALVNTIEPEYLSEICSFAAEYTQEGFIFSF